MTQSLITDVLVVGGGGAGISAALSAYQHGARVTVLEKMDTLGGSTGMSGGGISATNTRFQREQGIKDTKQSWLTLWHARETTSNPDGPYPDYDFVDYYMDEAVKTTEWLVDDAGHHYGEITGFGLDPVKRIHFPGKGGELGGPLLINNLSEALAKTTIKVMVNTVAKKLLTNDQGAVIGVLASTPDGDVEMTAKKVILSSGGFAKSKRLLQKFIPAAPNVYEHSYSGAGNQGDGILMAQAIGAVLYEDPWVIGEGITTNVPHTFPLMMDWSKVFVDGNGKRFMSEQTHYAVVTNAIIAAKTPWLILDSATTNAEIIEALKAGIASGEVVTAPDCQSLAEQMQIPADTFTKTMATYNKGAHDGEDAMGKEPEFTVAVETAPYFAVKIYPVIMGTFGGVKTSKQFEVLDKQGQVIPNLFATGETANKVIYNHVYMSGSSVQFALTSGRIAGQVAAETL